MQPFYDPDLARVHDEAYGEPARAAARTVVRLLRKAGIRDGLVVDLGCGTGITAAALLAEGYDVLGADVSEGQLAIARERAPRARFTRASVQDLEIPPCQAVSAIGEVFNYAADARAGREATAAVFRRVHGALAPGGLFVFDVAGPGRERARQPRRTFAEGDGWTMCLEAHEDAEARTLTRRIALFTRDGDRYRRSDELHTLRLHDRDDVLADLHAAGFEARLLRGYDGGERFRRGHAGFAALKR